VSEKSKTQQSPQNQQTEQKLQYYLSLLVAKLDKQIYIFTKENAVIFKEIEIQKTKHWLLIQLLSN
jgi:hypothetical protein